MGRRLLLTGVIILLTIAAVTYKLKPKTIAPVPTMAPTILTETQAMLTVKSSAFSEGEIIPRLYTCDGASVNPPLTITDIPAKTQSLTLIMYDPDVPRVAFTHWMLWNIDPAAGKIAPNSVPPGAVAGQNGGGKTTYIGPCPPTGMHRYFFLIYALDTKLDLPKGASRDDLEKAMEAHVVGQGELMGKYQRNNSSP